MGFHLGIPSGVYLQLTARGCTGNTRKVLASQEGGLLAELEASGRLVEVGEGVSRCCEQATQRMQRPRGEKGCGDEGFPLQMAFIFSSELRELAMSGILGDLIFYVSVLDLAHTLLNLGYQPGLVAFGGREASLYLGYFWDKSTDLSELQYGFPRWR